MSLSSLIRRKNKPAGVAAATSATVATPANVEAASLAGLATLALANPGAAPLTANEETANRAWLELIEETDPATIAEVIGQCQRDADARACYAARAADDLPKIDRWRVTRCADCCHFTRREDHPHLGRCAAGMPEAVAGLWDTDRRHCKAWEARHERGAATGSE